MLELTLRGMGILITALPYWWIVDTWLKMKVSPWVDLVGMIVICLSIPQYARVIRPIEDWLLRALASRRHDLREGE
ncbi:MAG: hypothetical protein K2Q23_17480 [Bryobacteraceae bacterium]|nr:hypothetical protein [Bryobacteraceae bacterium]